MISVEDLEWDMGQVKEEGGLVKVGLGWGWGWG
jgi:hypothetical protein